MARDIEEFLRKAAERRKQAQQGGAAPAPAAPARQEPQPAAPRPAAPQPNRPRSAPSAKQPKPQPPQPLQQRQEPVQAEVVWSKRESVAEHVQSHINTSEIREHVRHLGEEVGLADDKLEHRLHEKFDHTVGSLDRKTARSDADSVGSDQLLELLRNPHSLRQAILLSEILKRPEF